MARSKKDPNQIIQYEHNDDLNAKRVEIVSAEMSMELDADDGDSVQTQGRVFEYANMADNTPVPCTACREVKMYVKSTQAGATGDVVLSVSADDTGDAFEIVTTLTPSATDGAVVSSDVKTVLAKRMKVTGVDGDVEVKVLGRG